MDHSQITHWCHEVIRSQVKEGGRYIDATMGNGNDTLFLCELAGENGYVTAFDIQEKALEHTKALLESHGVRKNFRLILDGHEHMAEYEKPDSMDLVCFNFGYLPGGDHRIATRPETSVWAVEAGLSLLKHGGMMSLCIYSGGDTGFEEKGRILEYLRELSPKDYTVIVNEYYNRKNHPPMPVFLWKR